MSNCGPVRRVRSCRIVSIGNGFGQPSGVVAVAGGVTGGVGDIDGDLVEVVWKKVISTQQPNRFLIKQTAKFEVRSNVSSCNVDKSPSFLTLIYP